MELDRSYHDTRETTKWIGPPGKRRGTLINGGLTTLWKQVRKNWMEAFTQKGSSQQQHKN
jgi:hypothetical protein